jgi:transcriptional regulator with XRE-family HTH domain
MENDKDRYRTILVRSAIQEVSGSGRRLTDLESLERMISFIKKSGETKGLTITEEEMARKMGLTPEQLSGYLSGAAKTPNDTGFRLESAYEDLLNGIRMDENRKNLAHTIVWIRNHGRAYLRGEYDTLDELSYMLSTAYKDLIKDVTKVVIVEDIDMIMRGED